MMTLYHNQQRIMVEGMIKGHFRIIGGHQRSKWVISYSDIFVQTLNDENRISDLESGQKK